MTTATKPAHIKKMIWAAAIALMIHVSLVFASDLPAPTIVDYQQQVLKGGGIFKANENVQGLANWLEITVSCDYADSGFDPSQYSCLVGASADHYKFVQITHIFNKEKGWGMDRWRLSAPVTGNLQVYAGTQFRCDACVFKMTLVQIQGVD